MAKDIPKLTARLIDRAMGHMNGDVISLAKTRCQPLESRLKIDSVFISSASA